MFRDGNKLYLEDMSGYTVDSIPKGNWVIQFDQMQGIFFLKKTADFTVPEKMYGNVEKFSTRYVNTFNANPGNMGVSLTGMKGTGKSMLAKDICLKADVPVLIVQEPYADSKFKEFITRINQDIVMLFDEFEKVYPETAMQNGLLSLMDGVFNNDILFILTVNEAKNVTQYMDNRLKRIRYNKHYEGLEQEIIEEVARDILDDEVLVQRVLNICTYVGEVSMDIVLSVVNEVKLYPADSSQVLIDLLNISPSSQQYSVTITMDGTPVAEDIRVWANPLYHDHVDLDWYGENIRYALEIENHMIFIHRQGMQDAKRPTPSRKEPVGAAAEKAESPVAVRLEIPTLSPKESMAQLSPEQLSALRAEAAQKVNKVCHNSLCFEVNEDTTVTCLNKCITVTREMDEGDFEGKVIEVTYKPAKGFVRSYF